MDNTNLTIDDIDRGLLVEQINAVIAEAIADIADINKEATKTRTVAVAIRFQPSKSRRECTVDFQVILKPSTHIPRDPTTIYLGKAEDGTPIAKPYVPNQQVLPGVENALSGGDGEN